MADEFVDVRLRLRDGRAFIAETNQAGQAVKRIGTESEMAGRRAGVANTHLGRTRSAFAGLGASAKAGAVGLAGMGAGLALIGGGVIKSSIDSTVELGVATRKLSTTTGMDTKSASEWVQMGKARDIQAKQLQMGFVTLSRQMYAVNQGSKSSISAFKQLGVSMKDVRSGNTQAVLLQVADAFQKMHNPADRAALAQRMFGRAGKDLLPLLAQGSKALQSQLGLIDQYGGALDKNGVNKAIAAAAAERKLKVAWESMKLTIGLALIPALEKGMNAFMDFLKQLRTGHGTFGRIATAVKDVAHWFQGLPGPVKQATIAVAGLGLVLLGGGVGAVLAALAAGAVLISRNWKTIGPVFDSVKRAITKAFGDLKGSLGMHTKDWKKFGDAIANVVTALKFVWEHHILPVIKKVWEGVKQYLSGVFKVIGGIIKIFTGILTGDFGKAWDGVKQTFVGGLNIVLGVLRVMTAPVRALVGAVAGAITGILGAAWRWMGNAAGSAVNSVAGAFRTAIRIWTTPVRLGVQAIIAAFNAVSSIPGRVIGWLGRVVSWLGGMPGKIAGVAKTMWKPISDFFKSAINEVIGAWNQLHFTIGGWHISGPGGIGSVTLPKVTVGMPHISPLAAGGMLPWGGLALVGEQGPELLSLPSRSEVTPLAPGRAAELAGGQGPGDLTVHVPVNLDGRQVAEVVAQVAADRAARR